MHSVYFSLKLDHQFEYRLALIKIFFFTQIHSDNNNFCAKMSNQQWMLIAVIPFWSVASTLIPASFNKSLTTSEFPFWHAKCKGVLPSLSGQLTSILTFETNNCTASTLPSLHAQCNGVIWLTSVGLKLMLSGIMC